LPAGAVARDYFECGLIAELIKIKKISIEVWCHEGILDYIKKKYSDYNLKIDLLPNAPLGWFNNYLLKLRHFFTRRKLYAGVRIVFSFEKFLTRNKLIELKINSTKPEIIIFPTPRYIESEVILGLLAHKLGIRLLCIVSSWDNMSKNPLILRFDNIFVWNKQMKKWAIERHFYQENQIEIVGALQFDPHFCRLKQISRNRERKSINIVYATMGLLNWHFKEDEFIRYLYSLIRGLKTNKEVNLILRLHPHDQTRFKHEFENLQELEIHSNRFKNNQVNRSGDWFMNQNDIKDVQDLLLRTDLMLNMGTTLHIESVMFDVPSFIVNFHPTNDEYTKTNLKKIAFDKHFRPLIEKGLISFLSSENDLIQILERIVNGENHFVQENENLINEIAEYSDGQTAKRITSGIGRLIEKKKI
jgi:hypothetical protein